MIGGLVFLHPFILAGLAALPALWLLLRVTPPPPRVIPFPPARFLAGLASEETTASRTPWWILLLRLLCLALIVVGLAGPVLHPAAALPGRGAVRIVIDDGWASAQGWTIMIDAAEDAARRAARDNRPVYLLTTAPPPGGGIPVQQGPFTEGAALSALRGLTPHPWPSDYDAAGKAAAAAPVHAALTSLWLTTGLQDEAADGFAELLQTEGGLIAYAPRAGHLPILLRPLKADGATLTARAASVETLTPDLQLQATGTAGRVLGEAPFEENGTASLDLPAALRADVRQLRLPARGGAGGVLLLGDQFRRRLVGIAADTADNDAHLTDPVFYIRAALSPGADLVTGPIKTLLARKPAVIILPDIGALPADELGALDKWVRNGGLLLRFAGPNMTQGTQFLTPVALHAGDRATGGAMSWTKPQTLGPFPPPSPYFGLTVPKDIAVNQQLLAEPEPGLAGLTWAALTDGTPLVTAKPLDRGLLVLVHTTATPDWSNFALSGLFVQMLQRTIAMAGQSPSTGTETSGMLQPRLILDGFGRLQSPPAWVQPLPAQDAASAAITARHPPGYYGDGARQVALNAGASLPVLSRLPALPNGAEQRAYGDHAREIDLTPRLLMAAFLLFLLDWLAMIGLRTGARFFLAAIMLCIACAGPAHATDPNAAKYAANFYLAYIRTGDAVLDAESEQGLNALAGTLRQRTSVEASGVAAVDPARDELSFFPLLYWPVANNPTPLPPETLRRVQDYLDHGGTILFDTHDQGQATGGRKLQTLTEGLNIPPLMPVPQDHVLTKSFYLLRNFPVRYDEGTLWVEETSSAGRDGVSSVVVADHGWAAAWSDGGDVGEMDRRFGVNLVLYALTGNYKNDQVHLKQIIERLRQ